MTPEQMVIEAGPGESGEPLVRLRLPDAEFFDFTPHGAALLARRVVLASESANAGAEQSIGDGGAQECVAVESFQAANGTFGVEIRIVTWQLRFHPASAIRFAARLRLAEMACEHSFAMRIEDGELTAAIIEHATESMKLEVVEALCGASSND
jgi:hypothetical protein